MGDPKNESVWQREWDRAAQKWAAMMIESPTKMTEGGPWALLLQQADSALSFDRATAILDNGCGSGTVTARLLDPEGPYAARISSSCSLTCTDFSPSMVDLVRRQVSAADPPAFGRVQSLVQDAMTLTDIKSDSQSHVIANLLFLHTPDPVRCLAASRRVLQKDGLLAFSVLGKATWLDAMNEVERVRPGTAFRLRPEWSEAGALTGVIEAAGFRDVDVTSHETGLPFETYRQLLDVWWGMPGYAAAREALTAEEMKEAEGYVLAKMKEICPEEPGVLPGMVLIATAST